MFFVSAENFEYDLMGNRSFETITKLNKNNVERQKKFSYDTNNLNQYLDRSIYVDIEEAVEETGTGEIIPDTTSTGSIEVVDTQIITEEEFLEEEIIEEVTSDEEEIELEGRLIYDANGNIIGNMLNKKRQYIYSYDYKNRLVKIEKNLDTTLPNPLFTSEGTEPEFITKTKIVEISYDVLGRRIQKLFNNGSYRNYIYSNQHVILEENYSKKDKLKNSKQFTYSDSLDDVLSMKLIENKTRKIEEEYVNAKGKTKTRKIKENYTETNTYYYQKDHLGSIIAITDEIGTIVEEYAYDIFGKPYSKQLDGTITRLKKSPIGNTKMYTGREYDRGLKLYYNRARYYDPKLARFISRDPIDIADDVNLYAYVGNNSVMFVDLNGLEAKSSIGEKISGGAINVGLFIGAAITGTAGQVDDEFQIAPSLLLIFTAGDGLDKVFNNNHPISKGVKESFFYQQSLNKLKKEKYLKKILDGEKVESLLAKGQSIEGHEKKIKEFDIGLGLGKTTSYIYGELNSDGNISTTLIIEDTYDFHEDKGFFNDLAYISQENGFGKSFDYQIIIKDTILINN